MYDGPQDVLDARVREADVVHRREEVAHVEDADDLVERAAVDGIARVRRVDHRGEHLLGRQVDRERDHLGPRHHHVRGLLVGEVEDLVEHLLLLRLDLAAPGRVAEQHPQLGLGVDAALRVRLEPERAEDELRRALQHPDHRLHQHEEAAHGVRHRERRPLRIVERDALRHELADHDVEERDDEEREDHGDHRRDERVEDLHERMLAERSDRQARERDAELHRRDEARRVGRDPQHGARTAVALLLELGEPGAPHRHEAVLGGDEERVQKDDRRDGDQLERKCHAPPSGASVLGRSSAKKIYAAV